MRRTDIGAGVILFVAAALALLWLIPAHTFPAQSESNLAPAFMPSVALTIVLGLALLLVASRLGGSAAGEGQPHEEFGTESRGFGRAEARELALWAGAAVVTMLILKYVGFIAAGVLLLVATMLFMGERRLWVVGATALATPTIISIVAWHAFTVQMP